MRVISTTRRCRGSRARAVSSALFGILVVGTCAYAAGAEHPMLPKIDSQACSLCHDDLVPGNATLHAAAADDCTSCHVFESAEGGMTVALSESEPALCLMCHDDKAAAAAGESSSPHYPVTESCLTCHDPHGGALPSLLTAPITPLCSDCHDRADLVESH
ncbi:MAG: cytochrome c3 family protein, partial [Planctomycetota bacterium]